MADSIDGIDTTALLQALRAACAAFRQQSRAPETFRVDEAYVYGSRGAAEATAKSDLDVLLSMTGRSDDLSEDGFEALCDDFQSFILWEQTENLIAASGLDLPPAKTSLDVVVFSDGVAQLKLDEYMTHGGYQNVYSLTDDAFLY